jgi:aspartate carbamoyltransferase
MDQKKASHPQCTLSFENITDEEIDNLFSNKYKGINTKNHILTVKTMTKEYIDKIINLTALVYGKHINGLYCSKNRILTTIFYEASTRTSCSFQAAMLQLGGQVITINEEYSSIKKGETLEDTIRAVSTYSDIIVLRHPERESVYRAVEAINNDKFNIIINAGNGTDEHPTQALLDLYTIMTELKASNYSYLTTLLPPPINVVFVGDLKNGRTVHSLVHLLSKYTYTLNQERSMNDFLVRFRFTYCYPGDLGIPDDVYREIAALGIEQTIFSMGDLTEAVKSADVLYVTRIQRERFNNPDDYEKVKASYCINKEMMKFAKDNMIVMHPFPRTDELSIDIDDDPRCVYFQQMKNGLYVRMAILSDLLGSNG